MPSWHDHDGRHELGRDDEDGRFVFGVLVGLLCVVPLWCVVGYAIWQAVTS